jgi:excisionase family DNA binding protein
MNTSTQPNPILVTVPEAIRLTGLGRTKIFELIREAKLKSVTVGRRRLIRFDSIAARAGEAA